MKIHFTSLFSIDYDVDLFTPWIEHYLKFRFDTYRIFFHTNHEKEIFEDDILKVVKERYPEVKCSFVENGEVFECGSLRIKILGGYLKTLPQDDYTVIADSDEFQALPSKWYRELISKYDCICGKLTDRWGDTLKDYSHNGTSIYDQYPREGNFFEYIDHPMKSHTGHLGGRNKILSHRVGLGVNLLGSHSLKGGKLVHESNLNYCDGFRVLHFTFRSTYIKRMMERTYYTTDDIYRVLVAFNMTTGYWMDRLVDRHNERQKAMGWIGASER